MFVCNALVFGISNAVIIFPRRAAVERNHAYPNDDASRKRYSDPTDAKSMSGSPPRMAQIEISTFSVFWPTFEAQNPAFHQNFPDLDLLDEITHPVSYCRKLEG